MIWTLVEVFAIMTHSETQGYYKYNSIQKGFFPGTIAGPKF